MLNLISVISDLFAEFVDDISILLYELYYTSSYLFTKYMSSVPTEKEM